VTSKADVEDFLSQRRLAVVGASRSTRKFGTVVYSDLRNKGYRVFAVTPATTTIGSDPCYPGLDALPEPVDGVVFVTPPAVTEKVLRDVLSTGVKRVWMQQGSESKEGVDFCRENGITAVHGECILMFAEPAALGHRIHRWLWKILGKLPR